MEKLEGALSCSRGSCTTEDSTDSTVTPVTLAMASSAELRALAKSAYRHLYRASALTFNGDKPVLKAFRAKMKMDALSARSETDPAAYQQHNKHANEVANFLKRNVVQAARLPEQDTWSIRISNHTELGDNDSVKRSTPEPSAGKTAQ
ncbi:hypothetical protein D9757_001945 [Collybiopsis confluens]|uniref:Mitochondrial zinc maintenance protein 1, mitochondrial n=1 Tax=Collybiopsis confluens TaxID=2823264 RepID=A0A8H5MEB6_9AGAR|nr:hypothetical protein D9757_001945 [Collybiopsis confluens]